MMNTSVFRTVRVLRPLRSIGMMPGVRVLIDALIMSLPGLSTLLVLIGFVYAIFGVMGVQMFKDSFLYHCVPEMHCELPKANSTATYLQNGYCTEADNTTCTLLATDAGQGFFCTGPWSHAVHKHNRSRPGSA
eukprot:SAG11_NODE_19761_length_459_cov_1.058333_1_plen_132_part_10